VRSLLLFASAVARPLYLKVFGNSYGKGCKRARQFHAVLSFIRLSLLIIFRNTKAKMIGTIEDVPHQDMLERRHNYVVCFTAVSVVYLRVHSVEDELIFQQQ
jgi:hypothetical protein